jgi:hypothetical protein
MFFWQSSQEVEELDKAPRAKPLAKAPAQAPHELARIKIDTLAGMAPLRAKGLRASCRNVALKHTEAARTLDGSRSSAGPGARRFATAESYFSGSALDRIAARDQYENVALAQRLPS